MIDINTEKDQLRVTMDITLPHCPCAPLSLEVVDITGVIKKNLKGKLKKIRLDKDGKEISS